MKIGIAELFASAKSGDSYITTTFLVLGVPLVPIKSYFVYNKIKELGSCQIPLNRRNILKNYIVVILGTIALLWGILYFIGGIPFFIYDYNSFFYKVAIRGIPLEILSIILLWALVIYFGFFFDTISEEEKQERELFLKSEFATRPFPHQGYVPLSYRYVKTESLHTMHLQLLYVLFALVEKVSEHEEHELKNENIAERTIYLISKWHSFIGSKNYLGKPVETLSLCFIILSLENRLQLDGHDSFAYDNIKRILLS